MFSTGDRHGSGLLHGDPRTTMVVVHSVEGHLKTRQLCWVNSSMANHARRKTVRTVIRRSAGHTVHSDNEEGQPARSQGGVPCCSGEKVT